MWSISFLLMWTLSGSMVFGHKFYATMPGALPKKNDDYICTQIPLPDFADATAYVTAFRPIVNASVHHIILSGCEEELESELPTRPSPCNSQCRSTIMYAWAHNGAPLVLPKGGAFPIGSGSRTRSLSMEVHYMPKDKQRDYATVELTYTWVPQPFRAGVILMYNSEATIPPHTQHFPTNISCVLRTRSPIFVIGIRTHAHDLGKAVLGYYRRPGERSTHVLAKGNPQWPQTFYKPSQLAAASDRVELDDGDILMARCVFDSTNRSRTTEIGSTHADEMCNLYLMYLIHARARVLNRGELCADEEVPEAWEYPPDDALNYASTTPPDAVTSSPEELKLVPDLHWRLHGRAIGQISGVATASLASGEVQIYILHRGENQWEEETFDDAQVYQLRPPTYVDVPIQNVDPTTGRVLGGFGSDLLVLPHGISIVKSNRSHDPSAIWVTDVALHQVMRFDWNEWEKPSLIIGKKWHPGSGEYSFNQPTDVAVDKNGNIYVADGYWNKRIVKYAPTGKYMSSWGAGGRGQRSRQDFKIIHSLTIIPSEEEGQTGIEQICATDREHAQIDCYDLDGNRITKYDGDVLLPSVYSIAFCPAFKLMFGITGQQSMEPLDVLGSRPQVPELVPKVFAFQPVHLSNIMEIPRGGFLNHVDDLLVAESAILQASPHDLSVLDDGSSIFVAGLDSPYLTKINIIKSGVSSTRASAPETDQVTNLATTPFAHRLARKLVITGLLLLVCALVVLSGLLVVRFRHHGSRCCSHWFIYSRRRKWRHVKRRYGDKEFRPLTQKDNAELDELYTSDEEGADSVMDVSSFMALDGLSISTTAKSITTNGQARGTSDGAKVTSSLSPKSTEPPSSNMEGASNQHVTT